MTLHDRDFVYVHSIEATFQERCGHLLLIKAEPTPPTLRELKNALNHYYIFNVHGAKVVYDAFQGLSNGELTLLSKPSEEITRILDRQLRDSDLVFKQTDVGTFEYSNKDSTVRLTWYRRIGIIPNSP
jgi:hypothetical protein